jgi:hypothetical protein
MSDYTLIEQELETAWERMVKSESEDWRTHENRYMLFRRWLDTKYFYYNGSYTRSTTIISVLENEATDRAHYRLVDMREKETVWDNYTRIRP